MHQPSIIGMVVCDTAWSWMLVIPWKSWRRMAHGSVGRVQESRVSSASFPNRISIWKIYQKPIQLWPNALKCCANGRKYGSVYMWWVNLFPYCTVISPLHCVQYLYKQCLHYVHSNRPNMNRTNSSICEKWCYRYWRVDVSCWAPHSHRIKRMSYRWKSYQKLTGAIGKSTRPLFYRVRAGAWVCLCLCGKWMEYVWM